MNVLFQCSSASRKFLNPDDQYPNIVVIRCFSALQRAENSSIFNVRRLVLFEYRFSALQRAENSSILDAGERKIAFPRFSALQRAENSSIFASSLIAPIASKVSVLFSEPKIPQ